LGVKKILINTFHLRDKILNFIKDKNFPIKIEIIDDGKNILNTGGGIVNMIQHSKSDNFLIFNPDTIWNNRYVDEINKMKDFYFENKLSNVLLVVKKELSFDKNLFGNFKLEKNLLKKDDNKNFIYIGCQILNKDLFNDYKIRNFSINEIWDKLLKEKKLNGYESLNKFYHLTDLNIFKKLSKM